MPTVILLDNSLSMLKTQNETSTTKRDLATKLITNLIDHFSKYDKFEYLALVAYSSTAQVVSEFTRDYSKLIESLKQLRTGDASCLEEGLNKVSDLVIEEWACFTSIQVLLITDDLDSLSYSNSIRQLCSRLKENRLLLKEYYLTNGIDFDEKIHMNSILNEDILKSQYYLNLPKKNYFMCKYPFSFPNRFDIVCLDSNESQNENDLNQFGFDEDNFKLKTNAFKQMNKKYYLNELIQLNSNSTGSLYVTKSFDLDYFENEFCAKILNDLFNPFNCKLKCGHLESNITLIPAPIPFKGQQNYQYVEREIWRNLEIFGFVNIVDLTTPPTISRHLIVLNESSNKKSEASDGDSDEIVSFAILLHTSLKSESMAAIVQVETEWFGAVHCWNESKNDPKKNLMLTLFAPGNDAIQNIITKAASKAAGAANQPPALKSTHVKSYAKSCIIWYRQENLIVSICFFN